MAVNGDPHGGTSFLDLSGELRNAIYEYFIELDPSIRKACKLLQVNQQIRSEFGSLYLSQGNATIMFGDVHGVLPVFFLPPAKLVAENIGRGCRAVISLIVRYNNFELLDVISILRQYHLLNINIEWQISNTFRPPRSFSDRDIATTVSTLRNMNVRDFKELASVNLSLFPADLGGNSTYSELDICFKKGSIVPCAIDEMMAGNNCSFVYLSIDTEPDSECEPEGAGLDGGDNDLESND